MAKPRVFTSFDFDHDGDLRILFVGQSKLLDSPFELADWSVKAAMTGDWKKKVTDRIRRVDQVVVLCGEHTNTANGVSAEINIARDEGKPYFLLKGRAHTTCTKPTAAKTSDKMYTWNWENLKKLIGGSR